MSAANGQPKGRSYNLSLELGENSLPTTVNGSLTIKGSPNPAESHERDPPLMVTFGCTTPELTPSRVLRVRLDETPIGPHLLYEYVKMHSRTCRLSNV
jgi:hypothetical protein